MRRTTLLASATLLAACVSSPDYDGTEFACPTPSDACPPDFVCEDGICVRPNSPPPLGDDAGAGGDDAQPDGDPDAGELPPDPDGGGGGPQTLSFEVAEDTSLYDDEQQANFGDDVELHIDADPVRVALLRFDVSALPPNATVISAELTFDVTDPIEQGEYIAHMMLESWDEDTATWQQRAAGDPWITDGAGPGSSLPTDIAVFAPTSLGEASVALSINAVQAWVDNPAANFGIRWLADSSDGRGGRFASREAFDEERPLLRVTYE